MPLEMGAAALTLAMLPMYLSMVDQHVFSCSSWPGLFFFMSTCAAPFLRYWRPPVLFCNALHAMAVHLHPSLGQGSPPGACAAAEAGRWADRQPNCPAKPLPLGRMRSLCPRFQIKERQVVQRICETYQAVAQLLQQGDGLDGQPNGRLGLGALGCTCTLRRLLLFGQLLRQTQLPPPLFPVLLCTDVPQMMSELGWDPILVFCKRCVCRASKGQLAPPRASQCLPLLGSSIAASSAHTDHTEA